MLLGFSLLLNQYYLIPYHFDLGVILPGSIVASFKPPPLSSHDVVLKCVMGSWVSPTLEEISVANILIGRTSLVAVDMALYYASMADVEMSVYNQLTHETGQSSINITYPVRLFTHKGYCVSSYPNNPAKSAPT
jgi:hypothetical protein